ncbi:hypothetical protein EPO04_00690 [Patescibacteria group bacterium]|nr:MAG: hypothetical protein EPO04_00690 [Patescibacteria group bacterium]
MYSGFVSSKRTVSALGVHQRFDTVAYRLTQSYFHPQTFPNLAQILHFEGINGPDGMKVKSPGKGEVGHLYDPLTERGAIPDLIEQHYQGLVLALQKNNQVRAAFEAAWLAHYVCDGLTPAHHFPLDEELAKHRLTKTDKNRYKVRQAGEPARETLKKGWAVWGGKGLLTTHVNFEMGVMAALVGQKIKVQLDASKLAHARQVGPVEFFKQEAREIANLQMYERFYKQGWSMSLGREVKSILAPVSVQAIAIIWLLAYLESGQQLAEAAHRSKAVAEL